ncbi:MAG: hypothetical protein Q8Q48_02930 [Candidatus Staskawiczbacteria bacterium]|nr:hypothetical protein [Candidatus Staskawiczbacteria bacterium]
MKPEIRNCQNCKQEFVIESEDFAFYEKMKVPAPTFCPECRLVKRLAWRGERSLFKRKCNLCGKDKILLYSPDSPYTVYCRDCWWSDKWDPESYGKDYNFQRPFFEQFKELFLKVPRMGIIQQGNVVNSDYTNRASDNKDCYLIFAANGNENCSYGTSLWESKDSHDNYNIHSCELCFECIDCFGCSRLLYSRECNDCLNSAFLLNCKNCTDCFGCVNLRNKSYCIFNEQLTKEEYKKRIEEIQLNGRSDVEKMRSKFLEFSKKYIVPALVENHSTNVSGNWLDECKNVEVGFNCEKTEDGKYLFGIMEAKDVMDYTYWGKNSELIYECSSIGRQCSQVFFSNECWDQLIRAQYCVNCHSSSDLFGCVGLRKKQYCILNKQYSKEEYEKLVEQIKEQPFYGLTFPLDIYAFAYNETIAQELFPISKEEAEKQGYRWADFAAKNYNITLKAENIPDSVEEVDEQILKETVGCAHAGKCNHQCTEAFKVTASDLNFYKRLGIPIPQLCPNCRHFARLAQRNPIKLFSRKCAKCDKEIETSYAPDRPEIVYCEQCYNREVA